jgi:hypothetical protein
MRIMFDAISVTNETSYVPSSGGGGGAACGGAIGGEDNNEVERDGHLSNSPDIQPNSRKRPAECSPKGKKKKSFRDACMKCLVDAYEKKALSSNNSATSMSVDRIREEIVKMMEQVIENGVEEGSDEHYYATQLLKQKENHDMFITFKTSNGRLNWLRRAWEDNKKQ